jgi:hypothetical protein
MDFIRTFLLSFDLPSVLMGEVEQPSQESNGENYCSEVTEVALELIQCFIISYHTAKGEYAAECQLLISLI